MKEVQNHAMQKQHATNGDHHHHAFAEPERHARKWNDPTRDQWQHPEEMIAALGLRPGATVADIGAGTGYMVAHLSRAVGKSGTVLAIDTEAAMVEYLSKRSSDLGPAKVVVQKVGPNDPQLKPASMDAVLTLDTWHHITEHDAYAKKVYKGLKRGGRFTVVDYDVDAKVGPPQAMRLRTEQVTQQLEAAGFRVEVMRERMPRHYMIVGHKD